MRGKGGWLDKGGKYGGGFFTYAGFRDFLLYAKRLGKILPLKEWRPGCIILRHDVDLDVRSAHILARLEFAHDVRSTFFFLVSGPYNLFAHANKAMLRDMTAMGFEIGLHFDAASYQRDISRMLTQELKILGSLVEEPIRSISLHNPNPRGHGAFPLFEGYFNAYDPEIFSNPYYLSDSGMGFRDKDPYKFVAGRGERTIQMLFHPAHFSDGGHGYRDMFRKYLRKQCGETDRFWRDSVSYKVAFPDGLFAAVVNE